MHLAPPYSRKVDILLVRDLKFWPFGTFRKPSLPVTDFKRLENLVFATVTCDTTLPTQETELPVPKRKNGWAKLELCTRLYSEFEITKHL